MQEAIILSHLIYNEQYTRKVLPFLKTEYFKDKGVALIFDLISHYLDTYNKLPTKEVLLSKLADNDKISQDEYDNVTEIVSGFEPDLATSVEWLFDETEKHCQERALFNAIKASIKVIDGQDTKLSKDAIPSLLQDALAVSFDTAIGHDFLEDADKRYDYYHIVEEKVEFDLDFFNRITKGGLSQKTLNVAIASTGVGKTMFMTHCAAANLRAGKNVLYITMEMSEERIAERIDANLMDITVDELKTLPREAFNRKINKIAKNTQGKLIVKEYPTSQANSNHFRHLLQELRVKKNFRPDIIYIDYLNICSSSRMKMGGSVNSYLYIKSIAEELRGLAVEFKVPIVSATQSNRDAYNASDMGLDNTSESWGLPATVDMMFALISTEELEAKNLILVKQLKNRYDDMGRCRKFVIGIHRAKMKFYDAEPEDQEDILDGPSGNPQTSSKNKNVDKPLMDSTGFGQRDEEDTAMKFMTRKAGRKDFSSLKMD
jgi:replicative DNA helicase